MADFAEGISDEQAGRRLARAIDGRGAFRRFKAELHEEYPHLLAIWYAFRDARARRRAVEWLVDNELIDDQSATGSWPTTLTRPALTVPARTRISARSTLSPMGGDARAPGFAGGGVNPADRGRLLRR